MKPGDLVSVIHPWSLHSDGGEGGFTGRADEDMIFIKSGTIGMVVEDEGFRIFVTFGDRTCWLDELALMCVDETR